MREKVKELLEQLKKDRKYVQSMGLAKNQTETNRLYYIGMYENLNAVIGILKEMLGEDK